MDATKLEISGKTGSSSPVATYKPIPELDMEEEAVSRPKSLVHLKINKETDGADEKMLPKEEAKVNHNSSIEFSDVKISPGEKQNGDAKLDIGETKLSFGGMDKEELMKYANDPFWVRLRWFLFIAFWLLWAAMLVGAILIIYAAPKCDPPPPRTWWQVGPLTEVSSGITPEELKSIDKHIKGVIVNWQDDSYMDLDDSSGIIQLIKQAKELDMNVIVELDPTSSLKWFSNSENKNDNYSDYYIWGVPKGSGNGGESSIPEPPNNWVNVKNESSWKYSTNRKEFYYSPLDKPHVNFQNEIVIKEFSNVIEKFLNYGAAGISIRNAAYLLVDPNFRDENIASSVSHGIEEYNFYTHTRTMNLPNLGVLLKKWRMVVKNKTEDGPFMVRDELKNVGAYKVNDTLVVDLPLQAQVFSKANIVVSNVVNTLNHTFNVDNIEWPLWKANTTAFPKDVTDVVTYLLPGAPLVGSSETIDKQLLNIRETPSVMRGTCRIHNVNNGTVFSFIRVTPGNPGILVMLNTQNERVTINISKEIAALSSLSEVTVQHYSKNFNETDFMDVNAKKDATSIPISPKSVLVLSYVPKKEGK